MRGRGGMDGNINALSVGDAECEEGREEGQSCEGQGEGQGQSRSKGGARSSAEGRGMVGVEVSLKG